MINREQQIITWLREEPLHMRALLQASPLGLNDAWLAAGFVRNLVWDRLHGYENATPLNDIDVVYFNPEDCSVAKDEHYEQLLLEKSPDFPWSVKNQARMHERHGHAPYVSSAQAMSHWVEVETAIGARINAAGQIELNAPLGLDALFTFTITPNPRHAIAAVFAERVSSKGWLARWPKLRVQVPIERKSLSL
ncbi:nucleotidyltransferase family protein [Rahnella woolbedingensis]|uniref:Nucleotidyltransferase family protein n=1 Tax=Rahnella woolbedingensis TaxID=1510574 RepID=A0A419NBR2_9GAMM|nr:nucleotidyltransferase family protein [Rahnella woolbedingensis]